MPLYARTPCTISKAGETDLYGQRSFALPFSARCSVVKAIVGLEKTSVRTDSSATRGNAEETTADVKLLFPPIYPVQTGDIVEIFSTKVRVTAVHPRLEVTGQLDHFEVDGMVAESI